MKLQDAWAALRERALPNEVVWVGVGAAPPYAKQILLPRDMATRLEFLRGSGLPDLVEAADTALRTEGVPEVAHGALWAARYEMSGETRKLLCQLRGLARLGSNDAAQSAYQAARDHLGQGLFGGPTCGDDAPDCSEEQMQRLLEDIGIEHLAKFNADVLRNLGEMDADKIESGARECFEHLATVYRLIR